jgi:hypothetical protein
MHPRFISVAVLKVSRSARTRGALEVRMRLNNSVFLYGLAAFLLTGFFVARNLATWPARLSYPGDESYEGVALAEVLHLRQGVPIYAPAAVNGFDAATYGPLFYLLGEYLIDPSNLSYFPLRLLSVLGIFGCAFCCGLLAFWLTQSYLAAFLSPLVFLSYGMVTGHAIQALSDGVALFLSFAGFLVAYRLRAGRAILLAAPLMVLGFYYKPQYVAGPLALFALLLLEERYREAAKFAALVASCGLGLFGFFQWVVFHGQAFWRHFLVYQTSLFSWHRLGVAVFVFALLLFLPAVLGLEYLRTYPDKMLSCYLFFALLLGFLTYSKAGSGVHYFLESVILLCVLVPALLAKGIALRRHPADVILLLGIMLFAGQWSTKRPPQPDDFAQYNAMQSFLRRNFPPHARSLGTAPGDLLQAGLETPYSGLFTLAQLAHRGRVSDSDLAAQIQARRFSVIVLNFDLRQERDPYWLNFYATPLLLQAAELNYELATSLDLPAPTRERSQDRFYVYVPRSGP